MNTPLPFPQVKPGIRCTHAVCVRFGDPPVRAIFTFYGRHHTARKTRSLGDLVRCVQAREYHTAPPKRKRQFTRHICQTVRPEPDKPHARYDSAALTSNNELSSGDIAVKLDTYRPVP